MSIFSSDLARFRRTLLRQALAMALLAAPCAAQQPTPVAPASPEPTGTGHEQPLGDVARNSRKPGAKTKRVITEDDMDAAANILPKITMEGAENSDEIIAAIGQYKATHSPDETEAVVQAWYDRYDEDLAAAIQQNQTVNTLREENWSNGNEICREGGDYQKCEGMRRAEYIGVRHDQQTLQHNALLEVRIQHEFTRIRGGIARYNLHYSWFKIRTSNGIYTY